MPVCSHAAATMLCLRMSLCVQETWIGQTQFLPHAVPIILCKCSAVITLLWHRPISSQQLCSLFFLSLYFVSGSAGRQPSRCQTASCQWCRREQARYRRVKDQFGHKNASKGWLKLTFTVWPKNWDRQKWFLFLDQVDPFACSGCQWPSKHRKVGYSFPLPKLYRLREPFKNVLADFFR